MQIFYINHNTLVLCNYANFPICHAICHCATLQRDCEPLSSERDSSINYQTKPCFHQLIGNQKLFERESSTCSQTKPAFSSQWESRWYLVWYGNTLGCPSHLTGVNALFSTFVLRHYATLAIWGIEISTFAFCNFSTFILWQFLTLNYQFSNLGIFQLSRIAKSQIVKCFTLQLLHFATFQLSYFGNLQHCQLIIS